MWSVVLIASGARGDCEPWCDHPCYELNGDTTTECSGCVEFQCRPGAPGFDAPSQEEDEAVQQNCDLPAPTSCSHGWDVPAVHTTRMIAAVVGGRLLNLCVACGERHSFVGSVGSHSHWNVSDSAAPLSPELRTRVHHLCAGSWVPPRCQDGSIFNDNDFVGLEELQNATTASCALDRHRDIYGEWGVPHATQDEPAAPGSALGEQGQRRTPIRELDGCPPLAAWDEMTMSGRPYVLRGCAFELSPELRRWDRAHLLRVAANHSSRHCPTRLGDVLSADTDDNDRSDYRQCAGLPASLTRDINVPAPLRPGATSMLRHDSFDKTVMWLASGRKWAGRVSGLHFDSHDNLMQLVLGRKEVTLVDPVQSVLLYSDFAKTAIGTSPVDAAAVDLLRFPLAAQAELHVTRLGAGDILFIPMYWWHVVASAVGEQHMHLALTLQFEPAFVSHMRAKMKALFGDGGDGYTEGGRLSGEESFLADFLPEFSAWRAEFQLRRERMPLEAIDETRAASSEYTTLAELQHLAANPHDL